VEAAEKQDEKEEKIFSDSGKRVSNYPAEARMKRYRNSCVKVPDKGATVLRTYATHLGRSSQCNSSHHRKRKAGT
jgi:hypothetical protein